MRVSTFPSAMVARRSASDVGEFRRHPAGVPPTTSNLALGRYTGQSPTSQCLGPPGPTTSDVAAAAMATRAPGRRDRSPPRSDATSTPTNALPPKRTESRESTGPHEPQGTLVPHNSCIWHCRGVAGGARIEVPQRMRGRDDCSSREGSSRRSPRTRARAPALSGRMPSMAVQP